MRKSLAEIARNEGHCWDKRKNKGKRDKGGMTIRFRHPTDEELTEKRARKEGTATYKNKAEQGLFL